MSWFDSSGIASITKNALKEVQKKIDKALDITEENKTASSSNTKNTDAADATASVWGSFTGSFFGNTPEDGKSTASSTPATPSEPIVETQPPRSTSGLPAFDGRMVEPKPTASTEGSRHGKPLITKAPQDTEPNIATDWTQWEGSTTEPTSGVFIPKGEPSKEFSEVSLLDETSDIEGFSSSRLVVGSPEMIKPGLTFVPSQDVTLVDLDSANDDSQSEFSVKGEQIPDVISPDSLISFSSDCLSPCVVQSPSVELVTDSQSRVKDSNLLEGSRSLVEESQIPGLQTGIDSKLFTKDLKMVLDSNIGNSCGDLNVHVKDLKSPEESPTDNTSESVEISSQESITKSSSVEIVSSLVSSSVGSPEEIQVTDSRLGTDHRSPYHEVPFVGETPAITQQPTSSVADWPKCGEEDSLFSIEETPSVCASFAEDACESIHSASTSSTHTVLDGFPSQQLDFREGLIDTMESEGTKDSDVIQNKPEDEESRDPDYDWVAEESNRKLMEEKEVEIENLIEDALQCTKEANKSESSESQGANSSPDRETPPSNRSRRTKAHSEFTSGHSSTDEVEAETATSSGMEIISSPSLDGSNGSSRMVTMPLPPGVAAKVWMSAQKGLGAFMPGRAEPVSTAAEETVPSSLTTGFTSISESSGDSPQAAGSEQLSFQIVKIHQALQEYNTNKNGHKRNVSSVSEYSASSSEAPGTELERLVKKLSQVNEIVDAREAKVLELSHLNLTLREANSQLTFRLEEAEKLRRGTDSIEAIREECIQRLAAVERKFQTALKEKESLSKIVEEYREEAAKRLSATELTKLLEEKEVTIHELMSEGEKLSKQQLNYSNIIKKLRAKEKEAETVIKEQNGKLERQSIDLERLQKQLGAKEELERKQIDAIRQLTVINQQNEIDIKDAIADKEEIDGKFRALKEALDTAYREIADLQKTIAANDAEAQQEALKSEVDASQAMESALNELKRQSQQDHHSFVAQIHELKDSVRRYDDQANRKERQLKSDISDLQKRLSEADDRNKEMSDSVAAATRPLLRQLENQQASHRAQQESWEALEETMSDRLRQAQKAAASSMEKERAMKEEHSDAISELTNFQTKVTELELEKKKLESEIKITKAKLEAADEARIKEGNQLEALRRSFAEEMRSARRENEVVRNQLDLEKATLSSEKRKCAGMQEQLKERDRRISQLQTAASFRASAESSPTPSVSRMSASGSNTESIHSSNWMDGVFESSVQPQRGASLYDSLRGHSAMTVDIMTSTLRQREGELRHVQGELARSEAQKESLGKELLHMSQKIEDLKVEADARNSLKAQYEDIDRKYNALLQMYGEKVEEVEELTLDLVDVKEMYKSQIEQLLKNE